jgi:hypothetical protein
MNEKKFLKTVAVLSAGGTLFAGYLSGIKLFTSTCAFNEPCPYFLGYPACWYGFAMFSTMFIAALLGYLGKIAYDKALKTDLIVSGLGVIFAGYYVVQEVLQWLAAGSKEYALLLPTCAYGLIFYVTIHLLCHRQDPFGHLHKNEKTG